VALRGKISAPATKLTRKLRFDEENNHHLGQESAGFQTKTIRKEHAKSM